jgi:transposase
MTDRRHCVTRRGREKISSTCKLRPRVATLDAQIDEAALASVFWPVLEALMALLGVKLLTATAIIAELGDLKRLAGALQQMAYLGLVPSEYSSGTRALQAKFLSWLTLGPRLYDVPAA